MPLAQPLPALRRQLQEILTEDLAAALNALKELLPEGSDKHRSVLELRARFNDANKQSFRGVITSEQLQLVYNQIRSAVFDLIEELEEADFELKDKAASAKASAAKQGSVLYRVPHRMPLRKPSICTVRVALDDDAILDDIVLDDDVRLRQRVEVSDMMKAELLDPEGDVFAIRPLSEAEQLVRDTSYTQWLFSVTPRVEGEHQLLVKVSMMEFNDKLGKYVPREVSILETVTIVTETLAPSDSDDAPMKATGEHFALGPDASGEVVVPPSAAPAAPRPSTIYTPAPATGPITNNRSTNNRSLRTVALFLAFLMVGTTTTWAFTPPPLRDWWVTRYVENDEQAYQAYIEKYKNAGVKQVENAYFRKAEVNPNLQNLRDYQREYPQGQFREKVSEKIETLEIRTLEGIRQQPEAGKIRQFVQDFPESERLPALREAVAARAELLPVVESAYVSSIQAQPSQQKVTAFLRDFPQSERLPEVAEAAAARPEVLRAVQPALENVIIQKVENATTAAEVQAVLPAMESVGSSEGVKKVEQAVAQKSQLKKQVLPKIREIAGRVREREAAAPPSPPGGGETGAPLGREGGVLSPAEAQDWAAAEAANTARAYVDFVNKHPKTSKLPEARAKINALKPAMTPEEQAWADATLENSPQAYIYFVQIFPKGKRIAEARARIKTFSLSVKEQKRLEAEAAERQRLEQEEQARLAREAEEQRRRDEAERQKQEEADRNAKRNDNSPPPGGQGGARHSGLTMVRVAGGTFTMGSPETEKDRSKDECQHPVTVKTFEIGKYEVTQADWREVMGSDPPELYNKGCDECPVESVSWDDVQGFLKKLNAKTGKNYRLPTEEEWEYAARGGKNSLSIGEGRGGAGYTYSGSNDVGKVAWYASNYNVGNTFGAKKNTRPVGTKAANELGLHDMSGNVWEWCQDTWGPYPCDKETKSAGSLRVLRGGSWGYDPGGCRVADRNYGSPGYRGSSIGFRLAASPSSQ